MKKALIVVLAIITGQAFAQQQISLPVTWQDSVNVNLTTTPFGGAQSKLAPDPANPARTALRIIKPNPSEPWAGVTLGTPDGFAQNIAFSATNTIIKVQVFAPNVGMTIKLKAEDKTDGSKFVEADVVTTVANAWDTLIFNFANQAPGTPPLNLSFNHNKLSIFPNFGVTGAAAGEKVFFVGFVSNIMAPSGPILQQISLPITWQNANVNYATTAFGGTASSLAPDPTNAAQQSLRIIKAADAQTWAGVTLSTPNGLAQNIPFTPNANQMQVRFYSPHAGIAVRLKAEDRTDATKSVETEATVTTANEWQTLTFNFTNQAAGTSPINYAFTYNMISIFPNFGVDGATAGERTYFVGEVAFGSVSSINKLNNLGELTISPNPNDGRFGIMLPGLNGKTVQIEVTDIAGKSVYAERALITDEFKAIELGKLKNGIYICRVVEGNNFTHQKLVIRN